MVVDDMMRSSISFMQITTADVLLNTPLSCTRRVSFSGEISLPADILQHLDKLKYL